jgi:hypothetical protein
MDNLNESVVQDSSNLVTSVPEEQFQGSRSPLALVASIASNTSIPETTRLIQNTKGKYMFIRDLANLSLL